MDELKVKMDPKRPAASHRSIEKNNFKNLFTIYSMSD
jgi:hypothetical protein